MNRISNLVFALACLGAAACTEGGTGDGELLVNSYDVTCNGDQVTYTANLQGGPADGLVYTQETGNNPAPTRYADEHDLTASGDAKMNVTLTTSADLYDAPRNQATVFSCANHFDSPGQVLTYAFGVFGPGGDIVDCLAGGHDPEGLIAGDYDADAYQLPSAEFDLSTCVVAN